MTLARRRSAELMDRPDADPGELARSLEDLRSVNLWLGGRRSAVNLVLGIARRVTSAPVSVLDLGTGGADLPIALVLRARALDIPLQVTATDLHETTVAFARRKAEPYPEISIARADLLDLHHPEGAFDIVMCNTTLHHFSEEEVRRALAGMARVARVGVVGTDLARSRAALLGAELLARTVWRSHPITRHDGPVSVRAAFTPSELAEVARQAITEPVRVRSSFLFRLSLVLDRTVASSRLDPE